MKKLVVSISACMLLASGFAVAKDETFKGEIMDKACADDGGHESMYKKMGTNDPKVCTEACIKGGSKYVLHFRSFWGAWRTIAGYEAIHMIRKGQASGSAPAARAGLLHRFILGLFSAAVV